MNSKSREQDGPEFGVPNLETSSAPHLSGSQSLQTSKMGVSQDFTSLTSRFGSRNALTNPTHPCWIPGQGGDPASHRRVAVQAQESGLCLWGCAVTCQRHEPRHNDHPTRSWNGWKGAGRALHGVVAGFFMPFYKSVWFFNKTVKETSIVFPLPKYSCVNLYKTKPFTKKRKNIKTAI